MMLRSLLAAALLAALSTAAPGHERDLGAHEHGVAEMDVALVGDTLEIELRSPAMNIVGFEHAPRTEAQKQALTDALSTLRAGDGIFGLPASGRCELRDAKARRVADAAHAEDDHSHDDHGHDDHGHDEHGHDEHGHDEHGHEAHEDGTHSEIEARYRFRCDSPGAVGAIDVRLFEQFPATEEIRVQLLTDTAQRALTLTAAQARIELP